MLQEFKTINDSNKNQLTINDSNKNKLKGCKTFTNQRLYHLCNSLSPLLAPLADIVFSGLSFQGFKTHMLERSFHILVKNASFASPINVGSHNSPPSRLASSLALVPLSNRCEISQSTPFRAQRPRWHSFPSPIDVGSHNTPPPPK